MKKLPHLLIALSLGAAAVLSAQTTTTSTDGGRGHRRGGPGGHGGPGRGGHPIVRALDTDKDRELSAAELASAPASLRALDANKDGVVSMDELRPGRPGGSGDRPADAPARKARPAPDGDRPDRARPADPVMLALDANSDGSLSEAEVANATTSLSALDLNKDGKLTAEELRPLPQRRFPGGDRRWSGFSKTLHVCAPSRSFLVPLSRSVDSEFRASRTS